MKYLVFIFFSFIFGISYSCSQQKIAVETGVKADNKYDSEFPQQSISKDLTYISSTVRKLDCLVFYMNYVFPPGNKFDAGNLTDSIIRVESIANEVTNESVTGTSTVIYNNGTQIGLLTCAHVVNFPDSVFSYYPDDIGGLRVAAVKIKHQVFVTGLTQGDEVKIVFEDQKKDIAFLKKVLESQAESINVLSSPIGNTKDLDWGSVVYIVGYPLGNLMVTNAIVSNPEKAANGTFLTNALFNRGISGSPVLSIRDGNSNFELVGIASSTSAQTIQFLRPDRDIPAQTNVDGSYTGKLFSEQKKDINYGVTYSVAIEEVTGLLKQNRNLLEKEGFDFSLFFK